MKKNGRKSTNVVGPESAGRELKDYSKFIGSAPFAKDQVAAYKKAKALGVQNQVKEMDKPEFRDRLKADAKASKDFSFFEHKVINKSGRK